MGLLQNGFELYYVFQNSLNYVLIHKLYQHINVSYKQDHLEYEFQFEAVFILQPVEDWDQIFDTRQTQHFVSIL